jgi:hypothetical protein
MALIIEDGSVVANADSYVTRAEFIAYALARGVTIADDENADIKLIKAWDFINGIEERLIGHMVSESQEGSYPRYNLFLQGFSIASTIIPKQVKEYQKSLALDIAAGIDIWNPGQSASTPIKMNRVEGVVTQEFAVSDGSAFIYQSLSNRLRQILERNSGGMTIPLSMG